MEAGEENTIAIIELTGNDLTLEQIEQVAFGHPDTITVRLAHEARQRVNASRQVIEQVLISNKTVYGVNTGFGAMSKISVTPDQVGALQLNLVRSHAAGTGKPLDEPTVRAMTLLRANTLAKGFSGVRVEVIETLVELLNQGIYPVVPSKGSLGASGDLAPLAHLALVLIGEGEVFKKNTQGQPTPQQQTGLKALKAANIKPLILEAKEGLGLLNGTQMMTSLGTLTLLQAERLTLASEIAGAMTIEAIQGSVRPFDEQVAQVRPHPGHIRSARIARNLLANSEIMTAHRDCAKVQDPYSLRCIPQVHGMVFDTLDRVRETLTIEANAATDNPLVFPNGDIISQGNFHGEPVAMALDMMGIALAELASISERRIDKLMNPAFSELPAFLVGKGSEPGLHSGMMIIHYTAASLVSENKVLSHPACVDSVPTSNDKEDHVSMGAIAARKAAKIVEHARWVIAAELLCAAQGLEFQDKLKPGTGIQTAYQLIRQHVSPLKEDRSCASDVEKIVQLIESGHLINTVAHAIGPLDPLA